MAGYYITRHVVQPGVGLVSEAIAHQKAKKAFGQIVEENIQSKTAVTEEVEVTAAARVTVQHQQPLEKWEKDGSSLTEQKEMCDHQDVSVKDKELVEEVELLKLYKTTSSYIVPSGNALGPAPIDAIVKSFIREYPPAPPSGGQLDAPVILPQRRPGSTARGFVRAYAPTLLNVGISPNAWFDFLASFEESLKISPAFNVFNLAVGVTGRLVNHFVPNPFTTAATIAIHVAEGTTKATYGRIRANSFFAAMNEKYFMPQGLYCLIMTYNPHGRAVSEPFDLSKTVSKTHDPDTPKMRAYLKKNMGGVQGTTQGEAHMPDTAELVYVEDDVDGEQEDGDGPSRLVRTRRFVDTYFDKRAHSRFAADNPDSVLAREVEFESSMGSFGTKHQHTGRGGPIGAPLSRIVEMASNGKYKGRDANPIVMATRAARPKILYLMVTPLPSGEEMQAVRDCFVIEEMTDELSHMSSAEIAQSIKSAQLELVYERALREAERIYEEERVRALRVQLLLSEYDNDELHEQVERDEDEKEYLEETNEELLSHLADIEVNLIFTQGELKARLRDLDHLKTEVKALNAASAESTKILSEKLVLARELNTLKPELEHLKSQASSQQKLLGEKLALQRELSSIQVELETEKRAVQRIKSQEKSAAREDATLTAEIDDLKKELTKAHRDAQKIERENRKKTMEWEGEKEILEGKLDAFRNKLRTTKDQLKEAQDEMERLQAEKMAQSAEMTRARVTGTSTTNPRKRNVARFDPDMTIGTPGHGAPAAKKQRASSNVGDKSNFSITPFLNRTLSILPETPESEEQETHPEQEKQPNTNTATRKTGAAPKARTTKPKVDKAAAAKHLAVSAARSRTLGALKETTSSKANTTIKKPQLDRLVEEDSDMESDAGEAGVIADDVADKENTETSGATQTTNQDTAEPGKKPKVIKKRTNIFDEEDSAPTTKIRDLGRGATGNTSILGRINLKANPVGKPKTLAEFSPLKRDRRAASVME
ncbi:hypothetical protein LTS15_006972 [Exophiala xenobiotica]|nr:hypothetical protein LTS15_006972 [Exophiala xenobiotica]